MRALCNNKSSLSSKLSTSFWTSMVWFTINWKLDTEANHSPSWSAAVILKSLRTFTKASNKYRSYVNNIKSSTPKHRHWKARPIIELTRVLKLRYLIRNSNRLPAQKRKRAIRRSQLQRRNWFKQPLQMIVITKIQKMKYLSLSRKIFVRK